MSFKKKVKRTLKRIIGDFTGVQWRDLDHKKVYAAIALLAAVLILVVVLIVKAVAGGNDEPQDVQDPVAADEVQNEDETADDTVNENPLQVDAYEGINDLVLKYFEGLSSGNTEMVEQTVDVLTDEEKATIEKKKDYIEAYKDVVCYTKKGLEENSYVVFASYEMKIYNIETPAPGIMALYVCLGDDGSYYIFNGDASDELESYVLELASEEEVAAVIADVDARYQQLITEDEDLGKFAQTMLESQEAAEAETAEPEKPSEGDGKELEEPVKTTVNDGIRIREGRSTETRMLATIVSGTEVGVYANFDDGWSKIEYSGTVGYCKTEFLTSTEGVPTISSQTEESEEDSTEEAAQGEETTTTNESTATAVNKKMKLTDAVRIRKERSTDSDVLKTAYKNEIVKVLENYSDGWSKVDYNGTEGYCKTEYLAEAN